MEQKNTRNTRQSINVQGSFDVLQNKTELEQIDDLFSQCKGVDIREISILKLQELFASKQLTSLELTKCYLERIEQLKVLNCVIEVNPDVINEANKADLERNEGRAQNWMHGIPILIKENIATDDNMLTTAGSLALVNCRPKNDADVVKLLRNAGAVILGKANLSEFAFWRGTNIPDGWSSRGNQTKNPYNLTETPEGSSSGSAVAVAANLVTVSIGTETDGSLLAPACVAGICTIKPTLGLVSTNGVIPISHNQDTVGPMARTVVDLAILLDAMVLPDVRSTLPEGGYYKCITKKTCEEKFRLGVIRYPYWDASVIISENLRHQLPQLENILLGLQNASGFEIFDPVNPTSGLVNSISILKEFTVLCHDFKHGINEYLKYNVKPSLPLINPHPKCLEDIIQFIEENPTAEGYNQELLILSEATDGLDNTSYIQALEYNRATARELLDSVLINNKLDAVIFPSEPRHEKLLGKRVLDEKFEDSPVFGWNLAAISGYPSINIPVGIGLKTVPYGLTLIALPQQETTLLQIAYAIERMYGLRKRPQFLSQ